MVCGVIFVYQVVAWKVLTGVIRNRICLYGAPFILQVQVSYTKEISTENEVIACSNKMDKNGCSFGLDTHNLLSTWNQKDWDIGFIFFCRLTTCFPAEGLGLE